MRSFTKKIKTGESLVFTREERDAELNRLITYEDFNYEALESWLDSVRFEKFWERDPDEVPDYTEQQLQYLRDIFPADAEYESVNGGNATYNEFMRDVANELYELRKEPCLPQQTPFIAGYNAAMDGLLSLLIDELDRIKLLYQLDQLKLRYQLGLLTREALDITAQQFLTFYHRPGSEYFYKNGTSKPVFELGNKHPNKLNPVGDDCAPFAFEWLQYHLSRLRSVAAPAAKDAKKPGKAGESTGPEMTP